MTDQNKHQPVAPRTKLNLKEVLWRTFSEADERYLDLVRVMYALTILSGLGYQLVSVLRDQQFDMTVFGTGMAAILFGGGAAIGLRGRLEDGPTNKAPENNT